MKRSFSSSRSYSGMEPPLPPPPALQPAEPKTKVTKRNLNANRPKFSRSLCGRTSGYRGVTRHRCTGRYEAHLWDRETWSTSQKRKGRQVYLGAYEDEEDAAHTYDLAALKFWGPGSILNFPMRIYAKEFYEMQKVCKEEYIGMLRRRSSGFSRGESKYRGVAKHHHNGRWEARIGHVFGNKYLYLGTYGTQEEAAAAYDIAAIEFRGLNAVTNFDLSRYINNARAPQQQQQLQHPQPLQQQQQATTHFTQSQLEIARSQVQNPGHPHPVQHFEPVVMKPIDQQQRNLCMDSGFNLVPVPDNGAGTSSGIPDLFNDTTFEDYIKYLFGDSKENANSLEGIFENSGGDFSGAAACQGGNVV